MKNGVLVQTELAEGLPPIRGDRVELQQVILNLILNALEAMSEMSEGSARIADQRRARPSRATCLSRCAIPGPGLAPADARASLQRLLHDQTERLGAGAIDLPFDHRSAWRTIVGERQFARRRGLSIHVARPFRYNSASVALSLRPTWRQQGQIRHRPPRVLRSCRSPTTARQASTSASTTTSCSTMGGLFEGAHLLRSNISDWTDRQLWKAYVITFEFRMGAAGFAPFATGEETQGAPLMILRARKTEPQERRPSGVSVPARTQPPLKARHQTSGRFAARWVISARIRSRRSSQASSRARWGPHQSNVARLVLREQGHIRRSRRWGRGVVKPSIEVWATGFSFLAKRAILSEQNHGVGRLPKIRYLPRRLNTPRRRVLPLDSASPQERVHTSLTAY